MASKSGSEDSTSSARVLGSVMVVISVSGVGVEVGAAFMAAVETRSGMVWLRCNFCNGLRVGVEGKLATSSSKIVMSGEAGLARRRGLLWAGDTFWLCGAVSSFCCAGEISPGCGDGVFCGRSSFGGEPGRRGRLGRRWSGTNILEASNCSRTGTMSLAAVDDRNNRTFGTSVLLMSRSRTELMRKIKV